MKANLWIIVSSLLLSPTSFAQLSLSASNSLPIPRISQTLEIPAKDLGNLSKDLTVLHVFDADGKEILAQAVDTDFDSRHTPDTLIFQSDFAPSESKTFKITAGAKRVYTADQFKAHGRFVRERFDDFAWENDKIAHRTYGKGLETWEGEPLTSSTIDIWSKRTPKMVIDQWYMVDNYHTDTGTGADFYSAGKSRGCGATAILAGEQYNVSKNFIASRVLANGPIRVLFELDYESINLSGSVIAETKRISLDAGSQLDHFVNTYKILANEETPNNLSIAIGLKKVSGEKLVANRDLGILSKWESMEKNAGNQGLAVVYNPKIFIDQTQDSLNHYAVVKTEQFKIDYYAGFCWDKANDITTPQAWQKYLETFAQSIASPIVIKMNP